MDVEVEYSPRADRDLHRLVEKNSPLLDRLIDALEALAAGNEKSLEVLDVPDRPPWRRIVVGEARILYRPTPGGFWVERVVDGQELFGPVWPFADR